MDGCDAPNYFALMQIQTMVKYPQRVLPPVLWQRSKYGESFYALTQQLLGECSSVDLLQMLVSYLKPVFSLPRLQAHHHEYYSLLQNATQHLFDAVPSLLWTILEYLHISQLALLPPNQTATTATSDPLLLPGEEEDEPEAKLYLLKRPGDYCPTLQPRRQQQELHGDMDFYFCFFFDVRCTLEWRWSFADPRLAPPFSLDLESKLEELKNPRPSEDKKITLFYDSSQQTVWIHYSWQDKWIRLCQQHAFSIQDVRFEVLGYNREMVGQFIPRHQPVTEEWMEQRRYDLRQSNGRYLQQHPCVIL
jgi:hypothetical protein